MDSNFLHGPFWYDASDHLRLPPGETAPTPRADSDILCNLSHYRPASTTTAALAQPDFGSSMPRGRRGGAYSDFTFGLGDAQRINVELARAQTAIDSLHADNDTELDSYRLEDFLPDFDPEWRPAA